MYKVLDASERMTPKQIMHEFNGKWVYLVDLEGPLYGWFHTAIPAVVADKAFAGKESGIYNELDEKYNGRTTCWSFLRDTVNGFNEVLHDEV
ncbi:MAG: hypothetical protein FWE90_08050 [Defluviitaleaceae bacterium]|nr:hypothetical protein [Defluviitaleaceae bacterium]